LASFRTSTIHIPPAEGGFVLTADDSSSATYRWVRFRSFCIPTWSPDRMRFRQAWQQRARSPISTGVLRVWCIKRAARSA